MAKADDLADITRALSAPLGDLISSVGRGVADAQQALDRQTLEAFRELHASVDDDILSDMRRLGYQPTWYRIPEVNADISVALSATGQERGRVASPGTHAGDAVERRGPQSASRLQLLATPVDASFTNSYDYNMRASSRISFKIVAVPPAAGAEGLKVMPRLTGRSVADATGELTRLGIAYRFHDEFHEPLDTDRVTGTEPPEDVFVTVDDVVILYVGSEIVRDTGET